MILGSGGHIWLIGLFNDNRDNRDYDISDNCFCIACRLPDGDGEEVWLAGDGERHLLPAWQEVGMAVHGGHGDGGVAYDGGDTGHRQGRAMPCLPRLHGADVRGRGSKLLRQGHVPGTQGRRDGGGHWLRGLGDERELVAYGAGGLYVCGLCGRGGGV